jgi:hypothetical protein
MHQDLAATLEARLLGARAPHLQDGKDTGRSRILAD